MVAEPGVCGVPEHMHYLAGCRDANTMEKQKG